MNIRELFWSKRHRAQERLVRALPYLDAYSAHEDRQLSKRAGPDYLAKPQGQIQFDYLVSAGLQPATACSTSVVGHCVAAGISSATSTEAVTPAPNWCRRF